MGTVHPDAFQALPTGGWPDDPMPFRKSKQYGGCPRFAVWTWVLGFPRGWPGRSAGRRVGVPHTSV